MCVVSDLCRDGFKQSDPWLSGHIICRQTCEDLGHSWRQTQPHPLQRHENGRKMCCLNDIT